MKEIKIQATNMEDFQVAERVVSLFRDDVQEQIELVEVNRTGVHISIKQKQTLFIAKEFKVIKISNTSQEFLVNGTIKHENDIEVELQVESENIDIYFGCE